MSLFIANFFLSLLRIDKVNSGTTAVRLQLFSSNVALLLANISTLDFEALIGLKQLIWKFFSWFVFFPIIEARSITPTNQNRLVEFCDRGPIRFRTHVNRSEELYVTNSTATASFPTKRVPADWHAQWRSLLLNIRSARRFPSVHAMQLSQRYVSPFPLNNMYGGFPFLTEPTWCRPCLPIFKESYALLVHLELVATFWKGDASIFFSSGTVPWGFVSSNCFFFWASKL